MMKKCVPEEKQSQTLWGCKNVLTNEANKKKVARMLGIYEKLMITYYSNQYL